MNDLLQSLQYIGLSDKEAKIYLSLLRFGEAGVSDIANEANIKRPTAYVILDELRKKGLVIKIPHANKTIFQAKTPDELYDHTVSNINKFEKVLPKLRSMSPTRNAIKTLYFEGVEGLKEAMYYKMDKLRDTIDYGFFAKNDGSMPQPVMEMFDKWNNDRVALNIKMGGITPDHPSTREFYKKHLHYYADIIFAPVKEYNCDVSIEVTKKFVRIVDGHELKALIIENPRLADALTQIFSIVKKRYELEENRTN